MKKTPSSNKIEDKVREIYSQCKFCHLHSTLSEKAVQKIVALIDEAQRKGWSDAHERFNAIKKVKEQSTDKEECICAEDEYGKPSGHSTCGFPCPIHKPLKEKCTCSCHCEDCKKDWECPEKKHNTDICKHCHPPEQSEWDKKCKRCGKVYPVKGVYVCPCHPMFDKDYKWDGGYIEFSTPEDAQKALKLLEKELSSVREEAQQEERRRVLGEVEKGWIFVLKSWTKSDWEAFKKTLLKK